MRGPYEGKYINLYQRLRDEEPEAVTMTLDEIEALVGFALPESARTYAAWWANQERGQGLAWDRAGYKTKSVDLANGRVTFLRLDQYDPDDDEAIGQPIVLSPLTIAEAKERLAQTFGVNPSQIEITIRA